MTNQGTFIVLEGADGSGKTTQFKLLAERLKAVGYDVEVYKFPQYDKESSYFVRKYLNGDYGPASSVSPYSASMFYALDRFEAAEQIRESLKNGKVVLSDRYTGANMAHQGSKFTNEAEQRGFFIWADSLEYQLLGIPRPNLSIFLRVPAEVSFELIGQREKRSYTDKKRDEHEGDIDHLKRSVATYDTLCRLFPKDFIAIECTNDTQLLSIPAISDLIWATIHHALPEKPQNSAREGVVKLDNPAPAAAPKTNKLSLSALIDIAKSGRVNIKNVHLDWVDTNGEYSFYTPPQLKGEMREQYIDTMQQLAKLQQQMQAKMAKFIDSIGAKDDSTEKQRQAKAILSAAIPLAAYASVDLPREELTADTPRTKPATLDGHLTSLARNRLPVALSAELEPLTLLEASPRNEFEILSDGLYGFSDLPRQDVQAAVDAWTYDQKYQALSKIIRDDDTEAASHVRYRWDVITDQRLLLDLLEAGAAQNIQLQAPTPRYGYEVPELLGEAGLEDDFISAFDMSLELFSALQSSKYEALAAYAVLTGHKVRFQFTCNLADLIKAKKSSSVVVQEFQKSLREKVSEVHPLIGDYLSTTSETKPKPEASKPATASKRPRRRRAK